MFKSINFLILLLIILGLVSWNSCAGGKKTVKDTETVQEGDSSSDYDEIERLLGISREEEKKNEKTEKKNDDLITLLEVDEGKKTAEGQPGQASIEDKRLVNLQKQIEELKKEVKKKDMQIADLKAQLMLKEEELAKKQGQPANQPSFYPSSSSGVQPVASGEYKQMYQKGLNLFHQKRYDEAIQVFEQLLATDLNHPLADNAQYWIGECYYAMGKYQKAIMAFEKVFTFRNSNKNDYAQFKIGQCYYMLGNKQRARQEFQQLLDNYPDSELINRAKDYLARM